MSGHALCSHSSQHPKTHWSPPFWYSSFVLGNSFLIGARQERQQTPVGSRSHDVRDKNRRVQEEPCNVSLLFYLAPKSLSLYQFSHLWHTVYIRAHHITAHLFPPPLSGSGRGGYVWQKNVYKNPEECLPNVWAHRTSFLKEAWS